MLTKFDEIFAKKPTSQVLYLSETYLIIKKSPEAFRTISEASEILSLPSHVLRFWESKFNQIKPLKRAGGRRFYRPNDILFILGIKKLLHIDGLTIIRVKRLIKENGINFGARPKKFSKEY